MEINQLYSMFRLHYTPERNKFEPVSSGIQETPVEKQKMYGHTYYKLGKIMNSKRHTSRTERINFLNSIGSLVSNYEPEKMIRKSNMVIETLTTLVH